MLEAVNECEIWSLHRSLGHAITPTRPCNIQQYFTAVKLLIFRLKIIIPAFQHRNAAEGRISVRLESQAYTLDVWETVCPFWRHLHSVAWLICISNALISMHINDSNATERLGEKTDHGSMRFGLIRDNVHAVRPNRLP